MKYVWLLCRAYYPNIGGIETSIFEMSKALHGLGYKIIILTEKLDIQDYKKRDEVADIEYYVNKRNLLNRVVIPLRITYRRYGIDQKIDYLKKKYGIPEFVIARDPFLAVRYYKKIGKNITYIPPAIIAYDFENKNKKKLKNTIISRILMKYEQYFQEYCFRKFDRIVVFSNNVKAQIVQRIYDIGENVRVIYPGCTVDDAYTNTYEYDTSKIRLLFVGRIVEDKNLLMLVKAMKQIKLSNVLLNIVGDGDQREIIEEYIEQNQIKGIIFHGFQRETGTFYTNADYTIIPSKYESFGQVISESLCHGTPVIGFRTIPERTLTAIDELIEDGVTGFVVKEYSIDSLVMSIERALALKAERDLYMGMRAKCKDYGVKKFNWDNFIRQCINTLTSRGPET